METHELFHRYLLEGDFDSASLVLSDRYKSEKIIHPLTLMEWRSSAVSFLHSMKPSSYPEMSLQQFYGGLSQLFASVGAVNDEVMNQQATTSNALQLSCKRRILESLEDVSHQQWFHLLEEHLNRVTLVVELPKLIDDRQEVYPPCIKVRELE